MLIKHYFVATILYLYKLLQYPQNFVAKQYFFDRTINLHGFVTSHYLFHKYT